MFSHPYIYYMAGERFQEGEKFDSKNHLLEMRLKSVPQKLNLLMVKYIWKSYTLDCSCTLMPLQVTA